MNIKRKNPAPCSFTLVELLVVIALIALLAGLILGAAGGVRTQAARNQAKAEIAGLEAALARFQAENGFFPGAVQANPANALKPSTYVTGGRILFTNLLGRASLNAASTGVKSFFDPKARMVMTNTSPNYFIDPWGNAYGYYWDEAGATSIYNKAAPDLWSTAGQNGTGKQTNSSKWICNWPN